MEDVIWKQKNAAFLWLILASVCAVLLYAVYWFTDTGGKKKKKDKPVAVPVQADARVGGGRQRARRMRVRQDSDNEDNPGFSDEDEWLDDGKAEGKVGAKKQRKLEMKAEKRENRMAELESREERKKQEALLAAERKKKEEQKRKEEEDREEQARLLKEEQERKEYEEYLKLKAEFDIEESGDGGILTEQESQALLQQFIDFIKTSKVVQLEDVAARFSLKTQDVIDRLENLQEDGRITGVMDDRGKFIYISQDELEKVAKFIKQRGRISIAELAESSNTLIKLEESKIIEESSKVIEAAA